MSELVKERPHNPIEWLAAYLLKHDPQRAGANTTPPNNQQQGMVPGMGVPGMPMGHMQQQQR